MNGHRRFEHQSLSGKRIKPGRDDVALGPERAEESERVAQRVGRLLLLRDAGLRQMERVVEPSP